MIIHLQSDGVLLLPWDIGDVEKPPPAIQFGPRSFVLDAQSADDDGEKVVYEEGEIPPGSEVLTL